MMRRPTRSFKKRWDEEAKACRELAHKLVPCPEREALLEKARQVETASSMYRSLPSLTRGEAGETAGPLTSARRQGAVML